MRWAFLRPLRAQEGGYLFVTLAQRVAQGRVAISTFGANVGAF